MANKLKIRSPRKDAAAFMALPELRKGVIAQAPTAVAHKNFAVNAIANFLHPSSQSLIVKAVIPLSKDAVKYVLEPDASNGTALLAYFRAGQYITLNLTIGNAVVTRPYYISSSPAISLDDRYEITVKNHPFGFVSKYIIENFQKGTKVEASAPTGRFYHQPLRDYKNVIGICDTRGVNAFMSYAESIADGTSDINLTLLYACRKKSEALEAARLDEIASITPKFKIVYVLSDEKSEHCEQGFITKSIIEKYAPTAHYSVFVCGETALYKRSSSQLANMKLESKAIRFGLTGQVSDSKSLPDFPKQFADSVFNCKVIKGNETVATIPCKATETLLVSLERAGIPANSSCRSGECGFCRARLTKGNVYIPRGVETRKLADSSYGIIHPCCSYPTSDLTLVIN